MMRNTEAPPATRPADPATEAEPRIRATADERAALENPEQVENPEQLENSEQVVPELAASQSDESEHPADESVAAAADHPDRNDPMVTLDHDTTAGAVDDEASVADEQMPGDVPPVPSLWRADEAESFQARWRDVQLHFVDDPRVAAAKADDLINDAVSALTSSLAAQRSDLADWQSTDSSDTERLRVAVQRYRRFLDNLLDLDHAGNRN